MATRYLQTDFWSDSKIHDKTDKNMRYLMLYYMTNPHTNQTGCYELPITTILFETGFSEAVFKQTQDSLNKLNLCEYDYNSQEVLIKNWYKYNWTKSSKVKTCILNECKKIKSTKFSDYIDKICIPYAYGIDTLSGKKRKEKERKENKKEINKEKVCELIEQRFSRTISPTEFEIIDSWDKYIDDFGSYTEDAISLAITEAVFNKAKNIKYIDKILYNWAKQGLKNIKSINHYLEQYQQKVKDDAVSSTDGYEVF